MRVKTPLAGTLVVAWMIGAAAVVDRAPAAAQADTTYTVVTRDARRPLAVRRVNGQDMVALDELAAMFTFTVREDALAGGLTVTYQGQTIVLSPGQPLASVGGRLIALPVPALREGRSWLVPVEFLSRALGPAGAMRIDVRKPSRLVLVGDLRVPRVAMRYDAQGNRARLTFEVEPPTPHRVTQEGGRLIVTFEADALDARLAQPEPGSLAAQAYGEALVHERHRHRYEVNNALLDRLTAAGLRVTGLYEQKHLVEIVELPGHPWFLGTQFHAEYRSRPDVPHPLYRAFVAAALRRAGVRGDLPAGGRSQASGGLTRDP